MQFNQAPAPRESSLSDAYDPTADYAVDDLCIHDNVLYKCTTAISGGEAWNSAHWTETNVGNEIKAVNSKFENLPQKIVTLQSYYADYTYNTWVYHTLTFPTLTNIENAFIGAVIGASVSAPHDIKIISISGNTVSYIGRGMWSGGASGITAVITAIGT